MEIKYLLKNNLIYFILFLVFCNVLLYYKTIIDKESIFYDENNIQFLEYAEYYNDCIQYVKEHDILQESDDINNVTRNYYKENVNDTNTSLMKLVVKKVNEQIKYKDEYRQNISEAVIQAENKVQNNLKRDSFGYHNLLKGRYDLKKLLNVEINVVPTIAVESIFTYKFAMYFIAVIMILLTGRFKYDKKGLCYLVKSTRKGRCILAVKRCVLLGCTALISSVAVYIPVIIVSFSRYGGIGVLNATIQSIEKFAHSPYVMNFCQLLLIVIALGTLAALLVSAVAWCFFLIFRERTSAIINMGIFFIIELLFYQFHYNNLVSGFFRYFNVFNYLNLIEVIEKYDNWGIGEFILTTFTFSVIGMSILLVILITIDIFIASSLWQGVELKLTWINNIIKLIKQKIAILPLWIKEIKKIMFMQKTGIVMVFVILISVVYEFGVAGVVDETELELKEYYEYVQGDAYEKTDKYINDTENWIKDAKISLKQYEQQNDIIAIQDISGFISKKEKMLVKIKPQSQRIKDLEQRGIVNASIIDEAKITRRYSERVDVYSENLAMFIIVFIIMAYSKSFMLERTNHTDVVIRSSRRGGNSFIFRKLCYEICIVEIVVMIISVVQLLNVNQAYPLRHYEWTASIQSLPIFEKMQWDISFIQFEMIRFIVKSVIYGLLTVIVSTLSIIYDESTIYFISLIALVPYILECIGVDNLKYLSIVRWVASHTVFISKSEMFFGAICIFVLTLFASTIVIKGVRKWRMY